jgi:hypothetical protein
VQQDRLHVELGDVELDLRIHARHRRTRRELVLTVAAVTPDGATSPNTVTGRDLHMRLLDNQEVLVTVAEEDVFGNPVPEDKRGALLAASSDEDVVTVAPGAAAGEFLVTSVTGADGVSASVIITDDINQDGTGDFQGSIDFDLVDHRRGEVAQLSVTAGAPTTRADAPA